MENQGKISPVNRPYEEIDSTLLASDCRASSELMSLADTEVLVSSATQPIFSRENLIAVAQFGKIHPLRTHAEYQGLDREAYQVFKEKQREYQIARKAYLTTLEENPENQELKAPLPPRFFPLLSPEFRGNLQFEPITISLTAGESIENHLQQHYFSSSYIKGPFGDIIKVLKFSETDYIITEMGWKAFRKPGIAADLCVVFKTDETFHVLLGNRTAEPGKDKPAWFGGFNDITLLDEELPASEENPYILNSPLYTALKEGKEEADGLAIEIMNIEELRRDFDVREFSATVTCGMKIYQAQGRYLGTIPTGDAPLRFGGETMNGGDKRVDITAGYALIVDAGSHMELPTPRNLGLQGGDDMTGTLKFIDITEAVNGGVVPELGFGITHHRALFELLINTLRKEREKERLAISL